MDVNKPENSAVSRKYNITGFPTLLFFDGGELQYPYPGGNNKEVRPLNLDYNQERMLATIIKHFRKLKSFSLIPNPRLMRSQEVRQPGLMSPVR